MKQRGRSCSCILLTVFRVSITRRFVQMGQKPLLNRSITEMGKVLGSAAGTGCVGMWKAVTEAWTQICTEPLSELVGTNLDRGTVFTGCDSVLFLLSFVGVAMITLP